MKKLILSLILIWMSGCAGKNEVKLVAAEAIIYSVSSDDQITFTVNDLLGSASFTYNQNFTTLEMNVSGMTPNTSHAMHLHIGTLETPTHHWNQGVASSFCSELSLGVEWNKPFAGDIGNLEIDENGDGYFKLSTDLWSINSGDQSEINNTVLFIHETSEFFSASCSTARTDNALHTNPKIAGGTVTQIKSN